MKERTVHKFKQISHVILIIISVSLSINLFIQFSNYWYIKILLGSMAFSLETIKIYILLTSKQRFSYKTKIDFVVGTIEFSVYLGLAFISMIASLGFTFVSIEEQSLQFVNSQQTSNFRVDFLVQEIEANKKQIEIIQENASNLGFSAVERNAEANKQILDIQNRNSLIMEEIESLRKDSTTGEEIRLTSADMFTLLGEPVGLSGRKTMLYMMFILVFLLELALAITSGSIIPENILKENRYEINAYLDALFDIKGTRLNTDDKINQKTGISLTNCKRYRELLLNSHYNNIPLIESGRGGTKANFTKQQTMKIIQIQNSQGVPHRRRK